MRRTGETWDCRLEAISPIHIGSGETLGPLEYIPWRSQNDGVKILVLDTALLMHLCRSQQKLRDLNYLADRMAQPGFDTNSLRQQFQISNEQIAQATRYILQQSLPDVRKRNEVRVHIRDVQDRAYIPGSSLKGALRTALLYNMAPDPGEIYQMIQARLEERRGKVRSEAAAQPLEKRVFGGSPNTDFLRVLQVRDSGCFSCANKVRRDEYLLQADRFDIQNREHDTGMTQWIEAIRPGAQATLTIHHDTSLYQDMAEKELHFRERRSRIDNLFASCNRFASALLMEQARMLEDAGVQDAARWCREMLPRTQQNAHALVPIGWGEGWLGTTIGLLFEPDDWRFHDLAAQFRLARGQGYPSYYQNNEFPKTMWVVRFNGRRYPLGWAMLTREAA